MMKALRWHVPATGAADRLLSLLRGRRGALPVILVVATGLYVAGLRIWAYGDDFGYLAAAISRPTGWQLLRSGSYGLRPLDRLADMLNVAVLGYDNMLLVHLIALAGFLLCVWLVYEIALLLLPGIPGYARLAALLLAVLPVNVLSVIQIDTVSQQYASVFTLALVWWLLKRPDRGSAVLPALVAGLGAFMAFMAKETSIGCVFATPALVYLMRTNRASRARPERPVEVGLQYVAVAVAFATYMALRQASGVGSGPQAGNYALSLNPLAAGRHALELVAALAYWGSTLDLFPTRAAGRILISASFTLAMFVLSGIGLWRVDARRRLRTAGREPGDRFGSLPVVLLALLLWTAASLLPVILIGNMSELYTYAPAPFFALMMAALLDQGMQALASSATAGRCSVRIGQAITLLALLWLALGTLDKVQKANTVSDQARRQYRTLTGWMQQLPLEGQVRLCWRPELALPEQGSYSGFVMPERVVLRGVAAFVRATQRRPFAYVEHASADPGTCDYEAWVDTGGFQIRRNAP